MKLSIIIPVYNEDNTIQEIINRVRTCGVEDLDIVVVDDASTDKTREKLQAYADDTDVRVFHHEVNAGKGAAIRTAQDKIRGDVVVIQDADLEYAPEDLPHMLQVISENRADAVFGSRYSGRELLVDTFWHYLGNKIITTWSNILSNLHLTDMETCYKMIRADIFRELPLECRKFGIEPELTAKIAAKQCRIYEVPISYEARSGAAGKKIGWKDGVAALWYVFKFNLLQ